MRSVQFFPQSDPSSARNSHNEASKPSFEESQLIVLQTLYAPSHLPLNLDTDCLPSLLQEFPLLDIERSMPSLEASYRSVQAFRQWGKPPQTFRDWGKPERAPKQAPFFDANLLLREHRGMLNVKVAEIGFLEEVQLDKERFQEILSLIIRELSQKHAAYKATLGSLALANNEKEGACFRALCLQNIAKFFTYILFNLKQLRPDHNQIDIVIAAFLDLEYMAANIVEFLNSEASLEDYCDHHFSELIAKADEFQESLSRVASLNQYCNELRKDISQLELLKYLLKNQNFLEEKINPIEVLSKKFQLLIRVLYFYQRVFTTWRSWSAEDCSIEVDARSDVLGRDCAQLTSLQAQVNHVFGVDAFFPGIFKELFAFSKQLKCQLTLTRLSQFESKLEMRRKSHKSLGQEVFDIWEEEDLPLDKPRAIRLQVRIQDERKELKETFIHIRKSHLQIQSESQLSETDKTSFIEKHVSLEAQCKKWWSRLNDFSRDTTMYLNCEDENEIVQETRAREPEVPIEKLSGNSPKKKADCPLQPEIKTCEPKLK